MSALSLNNTLWEVFPQTLTQYFPSRSSLQDIADRVFKHPFFWALSLVAVSAVAIVSAVTLLQPLAAFLVSSLVFSILAIGVAVQTKQIKKWLFCEFSMMCNQIVSRFPSITRRPWFSAITHSLTLSACPLKEHVEQLKAQGVGAVLSMVEPFEVEPHLFGTPAKPEDWRAAGIQFLNLPNPDLTPVRSDDVEKAVEFIHRNISLGRRVLVHCQAGIARSATVVVCYLIKYRGMSPSEAAAFVKSKRSIVVSERSTAVRKYVERSTEDSNVSSSVA